MPIDYKDLVSTKKLPSGAKIFFFSDGKYKFFPSRNYMDNREKFKVTIKTEPSSIKEHCDKLIEDIFQFLSTK